MPLFSRFPSYEYILENAAKAFRRFPFTLLSAITGTILMLIIIEQERQGHHYIIEKLAIECGLGLALFTALAAYAEKYGWSRKGSLLLQAGGILILALHYFSLPDRYFEPYVHPVRIAIFALALHLLVAFVPYLGGKQVAGFWQYNKSLFLRILTAVLYSGILYAGLAIALAAVNVLFDLHIDGKRFFQLWVIMAGIFNTWIFLSGFPENLDRLGEVQDYPRGLRVFAQYILLPLVGLYLVILYAYELKIIITWNWPQGWVSHLVLWYSIVSILSLLLLWPLREREGNLWIKTFSKWFFRLLIPLIVMLFLAIFERIGDYGITVNRYLVIAMATGLATIVVYFVLSREKDIRFIPIVVFIIALLSAWGPWSAFAVAEKSQQNRLTEFLTEHDLSAQPKADTVKAEIPWQDEQQMSSIISYLTEWHGSEAFTPWIDETRLATLDTLWSYQVRDSIATILGFNYIEYRHVDRDGEHWFSVYTIDSAAFPLGDHTYFVPVQLHDWMKDTAVVHAQLGQASCTVALRQDACLIFLYSPSGDTNVAVDSSVQIDLAPAIESFGGSSDMGVPRDSLTFSASGEHFSVSLLINGLSGRIYSDSTQVNNLTGYLFFQLRP